MKIEMYRSMLASLSRPEWDAYLMAESGLPGPRGNLELAQAAAGLAEETQLARWRALTPEQAPVNSPLEFLAFCGVLGLGRAIAGEGKGSPASLRDLRAFAADPRWRTREAVAMALQQWGMRNVGGLLDEMDIWASGSPFEQRAAVAAICEPAVLEHIAPVLEAAPLRRKVFDILDQITHSFASSQDRRSAGWQALKKGLAYGWSVAVASLPAEGRPRLEGWFASKDPDVRWVMRENLQKARLERMDAGWVRYWREKIERETSRIFHMDNYLQANQSLWDEWTRINAGSKMYDLEGFKAGRCSLKKLELDEVGEVSGKRLLHLQCHFGMDTLSWARRGAQVTGVDFSPEAVRLAQSLSQELGIPARFLCCNLYDLPGLLDEQFDVVFTSYGVLTWLPDRRRWAQIAARYVRPGGIFYIAEAHPCAMVFDDEGSEPRLRYPYFDDGPIACEVKGSYADPTAQTHSRVSYEWAYPLGEVVSYLVEAGLRVQFLHEWPFACYQMFPFLAKGEDGLYRLPPGLPSLPLQFSLRAIKE